MSKLERITSFVAVADHLGFSAAARALKISTAAISKQISLLEQELGIHLFERSTRQVLLTDSGQSYYQECQRILSDLQSADAMAKQLHEEPNGLLKVTANRHFAERFIIPRLAEWIKRYPKIELHLELAERIPDMQRERIDILIGMSMQGPPDCIQKVIAHTRYVFCASPSYLTQHGEALTHYIAHSMRINEPVLKPILTLNDTQAMLQCAIDGIGIVKLHDYVVKEAIGKGLLKEIPQAGYRDKLPIFVCYLPQRFVQAKIRHFISFFSPA